MRKPALKVDDEESIQYLLSKQLEQWGYVCAAVSSGQEALEKLASRQFDLMLLDMRMPGMSGLEVLRQSRDDHPAMCVVMLSALLDVKVMAEAIALGADDYITKPCDPDVLKIRLQKAREHRELVDQRPMAMVRITPGAGINWSLVALFSAGIYTAIFLSSRSVAPKTWEAGA